MAAPPRSASRPLIAPALADRFEAGLRSALARTPDPDERLALAVSGGPDSMAMLALAHAARPGQVLAATFDHGLRAGAAAEAAMVAHWCAVQGIPHAILHPDRPLPASNIQAAARDARYAALGDWAAAAGARLLATAHHADDQAETFLMRANRGSGPAGLAGIRRARPLGPVTLVRPLLDWRRSELAAVVAAAGLPVATDPRNADPRFARVRARQWLAATHGLDAAQLARAADHVAAMAADADALADWAWTTRQVAGDDPAIDVTGLPRSLCRLLVRRGIAAVRARDAIVAPAFGPASNVEALLDSLAAGRRATQAGVLVSPRARIWRFAPAPPRRAG